MPATQLCSSYTGIVKTQQRLTDGSRSLTDCASAECIDN